MNSERSVLRIIQTSAADRLTSFPEFATVGVVSADAKDLDAQLDTAIKSVGICVVIAAVKASNNEVDAVGPYFSRINCIAQIYERVAVNRQPSNPNFKTGQELAEYVAAYLHGYLPDNFNQCYVVDSVAMIQTSAGGNPVVWEVAFHTQGGFIAKVPAVTTPVIDASQQPVSIATITGGAAIFYTLDGSFPGPRDEKALLYSGPFTTDIGVTVRAAAYLAGYKRSEVASAVTSAGTDWTYIGDAVRYRASYFQVKGTNEAAFHLVECQTPPGAPTIALGEAVVQSGGTGLSQFQYFGSRVRVGAQGIQLYCDANSMWYPFLVVQMFGSNILSLGDGVSAQIGATTGITAQWGTETRVSDTGLQFYNKSEDSWYLVMPDVVAGNVTLKLTKL